jgi:hypothetical protein
MLTLEKPDAPKMLAPMARSRRRTREQASASESASAAAPALPPAVKPIAGVAVITLLLIAFAAMAWIGIRDRCATYDEPMHALAGWTSIYGRDFRSDPENPPLWKYWAALPDGRKALTPHVEDPHWTAVLQNVDERWPWFRRVLYFTPENDADRFINRQRVMMLVLGVGLGALIATWGWQLGGGVAAIVATFLFAFDPNFLAHAPIIKNDVPLALAMVAMVYATWLAGRNLTWWTAALVPLTAALGPAIKFSGMFFIPLLGALLGARVIVGGPWLCLGRELRRIRSRALVAVALLAVAALITWGGLWATYQFRYLPTSDPQLRFDLNGQLEGTAFNEILQSHPQVNPTLEEYHAWKPGPLVNVVLFADRHHLLPQSWLYGMLCLYRVTLLRGAYLCGEKSPVGFHSYFPLAFLFKTPLATHAAIAMGLLIGGFVLLGRTTQGSGERPARRQTVTWTCLCLSIPAILYGSSAIRSHLNLGLRHILPIYPFLFLAAGWAASFAWQRWRRPAMYVLAGLGAALAMESLLAAPDYIPFFNVASGGSRGGLRLLGDSNLDWGQDLKLLAKWQRDNPTLRLYLCYFGSAAQEYYGIRYISLPRNSWDEDAAKVPPRWPQAPGVIAISATELQEIYYRDDFYAPLRSRKPLDVLGGSIYLFAYDPKLDPIR